MPKTRDAFALREYFNTIFDSLAVAMGYSFEFKDFFSGMFSDDFFPTVEKSVSRIEEIIKCKLHRLNFGVVHQNDVDNAREVLMKVKATLNRFDRHIQRLDCLKVKDVRKKELLIDKYEYAAKILEEFENSLTEHYLILAKNFSKSFARQVGRRLRIARQLKDLSQEEVANEIGVATITLSSWERATREPSLYAIFRLSKYLDAPLDFLFGNSEKTIN